MTQVTVLDEVEVLHGVLISLDLHELQCQLCDVVLQALPHATQ